MCTKRIVFSCLGICLMGLFGTANGQTTVTFQQGVNGYSGLTDIYTGILGVGVGGDPDGDSTTVTLGSDFPAVFLDGRFNRAENAGGDTQGLFRFDGIFGSGAGQIPPGARIISANMELTTAQLQFSGTNEAPHVVARLLVPFDANSSYDATDAGLRFSQGEPDPVGGERQEPVPTGETARPLAGGFVNTSTGTIGMGAGDVGSADITKIVREWQNGAPNHGVVVLSGTQNGWGIVTSSGPTLSERPKLSVVYDATPQPATTSATFTMSDDDPTNSMFLIHFFTSNFVNTDTVGFLNTGSGIRFNEVSFLTPDEEPQLSAGEGEQVLLRYDSIFVSEGGTVPDDAVIESAFLNIVTPNYFFTDEGVAQGASINIGSNSNFGVRQVLTDYDGTGDSRVIQYGAFVDLSNGTIPDTVSEFDVTSIVQSWQTNGSNFGFNITGEAFPTNGWGILNSQSDVGAPQLVINYQSASLLGDFDNDGDVDLLDLDRYNGNLGLAVAANPTLADLDLDGNGTIEAADFQQHYTDLVETSNGQTGTFAGDANLDGSVDVLSDAFALVGNLGSSTNTWEDGDFNADGFVDVLGDAFLLVANLGRTN